MERSNIFNYIEDKINYLGYRISSRGKLNLLDFNIHAETFFEKLLNLIFGFELKNINTFDHNSKGIDLIDTKSKIIVQVSSICSKKKIQDSLNKLKYEKYNGYNFIFILISNSIPSNLKNMKYEIPKFILFDSNKDLLDKESLLKIILDFEMDRQREIYDFLRKELHDYNIIAIESNIAQIINILSNEVFEIKNEIAETKDFLIENKISFNDLIGIRGLINDYKIYYKKIDSIYATFDMEGKNKSISVLAEIRRWYIKLKNRSKNSCDLFFEIVDNIIDIILNSSNYNKIISREELQMCVDIIVVDAFIRCKIFENPEGYNNVATR